MSLILNVAMEMKPRMQTLIEVKGARSTFHASVALNFVFLVATNSLPQATRGMFFNRFRPERELAWLEGSECE